MAWLVLVVSGACEAIWANALSASDGFRNKRATAVFVVFNVLSMIGLAVAMREISTGTAYAVWTGIGIALTTVISVIRGETKVRAVQLCLLVGLISCVIGLKMVS